MQRMEGVDIDRTMYVPDTPDRSASGRVHGQFAETHNLEVSCGEGMDGLNDSCGMKHFSVTDQPEEVLHMGSGKRVPDWSNGCCAANPGIDDGRRLHSVLPNNVKILNDDDQVGKTACQEKIMKSSEEPLHACEFNGIKFSDSFAREGMDKSGEDIPNSCGSFARTGDNWIKILHDGGNSRSTVDHFDNIQDQYEDPGRSRRTWDMRAGANSNHRLLDEASSSSVKVLTDGMQDKAHINTSGMCLSDEAETVSNRERINACVNSQPKKNEFSLLHSTPPRRKQRRLVRNGCISAYNTRKPIPSVGDRGKDTVSGKLDGNLTVARVDWSSRNEPSCTSGHADRVKGKEVRDSAIPAEGYHSKKIISLSRDISGPDENEIFRRVEEIGGWRCIHDHSEKKSLITCQKLNNPLKNGMLDENQTTGGGMVNQYNHAQASDSVSSGQAGCDKSTFHVSSGIRARPSVQKITKRRRKPTVMVDLLHEPSTTVSDDIGIINFRSSRNSMDMRPSRTNNSPRHRGSRLSQDVEKFHTPERGIYESQDMYCGVNNDPDAQARQVEADGELARQLQEQFYYELSEIDSEEADVSLAWTLQHEENARATIDGAIVDLHNYGSHVRNSSTRSISHGRTSRPTRIQQLRRSFRSYPRTTSSSSSHSERNFQFPSSMSLEMRLHLLEVLEAADNTIEMSRHFLQVQREFNENYYEILLNLDEGNHEHCGASSNQINNLPESEVKINNVEEACTICLETPSAGETIRHLPCLHKFHKECIDSWLRRKKFCPVCKFDAI